MKNILLAVVLTLTSVVATAAPDFPQLTGRVVDEAGVLDAAAYRRISTVLSDHERSTTNQVVAVTLRDLRGLPIEEYGIALARHWGIGQKGRNNGVLIILAPKERKVRIEVGYGLEGVLTDALTRTIIRGDMVPALRAGRSADAFEHAVHTILDVLNQQHQLEQDAALPVAITGREKPANPSWILFFVLAGMMAVIAIIYRRSRRAHPVEIITPWGSGVRDTAGFASVAALTAAAEARRGMNPSAAPSTNRRRQVAEENDPVPVSVYQSGSESSPSSTESSSSGDSGFGGGGGDFGGGGASDSY